MNSGRVYIYHRVATAGVFFGKWFEATCGLSVCVGTIVDLLSTAVIESQCPISSSSNDHLPTVANRVQQSPPPYRSNYCGPGVSHIAARYTFLLLFLFIWGGAIILFFWKMGPLGDDDV